MTALDRQNFLSALLLDSSAIGAQQQQQLQQQPPSQQPQMSSGNSSNFGNWTGQVLVNISLVANATAPANSTSESDEPADRRYWVLGLLLFPCFTIFGNILVVMAVYRERSLQSVTNYFIFSLAFADILVGAIVMPISVYVEVMDGVWSFGTLLCDLWIMCDALFSTASILNLVAISIDRFIAVTQPIKYSKHKNSKRTQFTIAATWLLSISIALPIGCGLQNLNGIRNRPMFKDTCTFFHGDFLIYSSLGSFYIPCFVMLVLYYRIFKVIWQRAKKAAAAKRGKIYQNQKVAADDEDDDMDQSVDDRRAKRGGAGLRAPAAAKKATLLVRANPKRPNNLSVSVAREGIEHLQLSSQRLAHRSPSGIVDLDADDDFTLSTNNSAPLNESMNFAGPSTSDNSGALSDACETRLTEGPADRTGKKQQQQQLFRMKIKKKKRKPAATKAERSAARLERKATKTLAIVLGVFLLCWLPFFISNLMWAACLKNVDEELFKSSLCSYDRRISVFIVWLGYVNSTLNPLIYTIFNNEFRKAFKKLLHIA